MYTFELKITQAECSQKSNLKKVVMQDSFIYYSMEEFQDYGGEFIEIVKKNKGVGVRETEEYIEIYNDPYCTIPIFIYQGQGKIYISSLFESMMNLEVSVDRIGFYETYLYESGLYDRTLFNEIKQLPSASYIRIDRGSLNYEILNYWNFDIRVNENIKTERHAIDAVWSSMSHVFSKYKNKKLVMGISGGLDSRLSLCVAKETIGLENIETFTFGSNENILDNTLASKVLDILQPGKKNQFFKLDGDAYLESMELPIKSGYGVGINHSHIYWCLNHMNTEGKTLVSNYYSDAIMGYDCIPIDYEDVVENCAYYKKLCFNDLELNEADRIEIEKDIRKTTDRRNADANFTCFDEFIYLVERNPKFHIRLSYIFQEKIDTVLPYAEYEMLTTLISLPVVYRYRKRIEHLMLSEKFVDVRDVSSTRYAGLDKEEQKIWNKIYFNIGFLKMRLTNLVNSGLNVVTKAKVQIPNKYITENQLHIFNRYFSEYKSKACDYLYQLELISASQKERWNKTSVRTADAQQGFCLIGIWMILKEVKNNG